MVSCGTVVWLVDVLLVGDGVLVVGYSVGVPVDSRQYVPCIYLNVDIRTYYFYTNYIDLTFHFPCG